MTTLVEKLDRTLYPGFARNWDDQLFRERILQQLTPAAVVLDLGAGAGIVQQMNFRGLGRAGLRRRPRSARRGQPTAG